MSLLNLDSLGEESFNLSPRLSKGDDRSPRSKLFPGFRFPAQKPLLRQRVENLRIPLGPRVIDDHLPETPFLAVARQLAIVAIHQNRVLGSRLRALPRHEMLSHHITVKRGRIVLDL